MRIGIATAGDRRERVVVEAYLARKATRNA